MTKQKQPDLFDREPKETKGDLSKMKLSQIAGIIFEIVGRFSPSENSISIETVFLYFFTDLTEISKDFPSLSFSGVIPNCFAQFGVS